MAFTKSSAGGLDGIGTVYTLTRPGVINAHKLAEEVQAATGTKLLDSGQAGHIVTATLAYGAGTLVQIRLKDDTPNWDEATEALAEQIILDHQP